MFEAASLHGLGDAWFEQGADTQAEEAYVQSLRASQETRFDGQTALCLAALAATAARRGELDRAAQLWASVEAFEEERGAQLHAHERRRYAPALAEVAAVAPLSLDDAVQYALQTERSP
jgi:hypothetical protein